MDEMVARLCKAKTQVFVVIDGAHVDEVDKVLAANDFAGRPVFQSRDRAIVLAGPWIVSVAPNGDNFDEIVSLARRCRSGVCWGIDSGEDALVRHLRILNAVRLPDKRMVYFRHYDPDVLAFLVPMFDAEQAAKLFGPAHIISFVTGRGAGAVVERPDDLPTPKGGSLCFCDWQLEEIGLRQAALRRDKIAGMLMEQFPNSTRRYSHEDLLKKVTLYEQQAFSIGLETESGHAKWAYLNTMANQDLNKNELLMTHLRRSNQNMDRALEESFELIIFDYRLSERTRLLSKFSA